MGSNSRSDDECEALANALADAGVERGYVGAHRFRLVVADRLIAAGYRKHPEPEITDDAATIERMARAMHATHFDPKDGGWTWETTSEWNRELYRKEARAALAALRVPIGEGEQDA